MHGFYCGNKRLDSLLYSFPDLVSLFGSDIAFLIMLKACHLRVPGIISDTWTLLTLFQQIQFYKNWRHQTFFVQDTLSCVNFHHKLESTIRYNHANKNTLF